MCTSDFCIPKLTPTSTQFLYDSNSPSAKMERKTYWDSLGNLLSVLRPWAMLLQNFTLTLTTQ